MKLKNSAANKSKSKVIVAVLILLCTIIAAMVGGLHNRLHIDEVWTYGLSNNVGSPFYYDYCYGVGDSVLQSRDDFDYHDDQNYKDYFYHWHTPDYYREYLTVQEDERFDYANVYANQVADTHPPLYYFFIHTVCSFFPDTFSIWFGIAVNLLFYSGSLLILYLVAKELFKSELLATLSMLLWGLSRAGITEALFIRMYMMSTFFALCLIYAFIKLIRNFGWPLIAMISLIEIAGVLTHYYFYIVAFYLTLFICLYFLVKKQIRKMFVCGFAGLFSVGISVVIFPATIRHLTQGAWSQSTVSNLRCFFDSLSNLCNLFNQVIPYYFGVKINSTVALYALYILFVLYLVIFLVRYKLGHRHDEKYEIPFDDFFIQKKDAVLSHIHSEDTATPTAIIVSAGVFATAMTIVGLEPDMGEYIIRYIFVILPMFSVFIVFSLEKLFHVLDRRYPGKFKLRSALVLCVCLPILCSNLFQPQVLLKLDQEFDTVRLENRKVIAANYESHSDHSFAYLYLDTEAVYPIDELDSRFFDALSSLDSGESVVFVCHSRLASINEVINFLFQEPGISFSYRTSSYYPLEINSIYYVFEITVN